MRKAEKIAEVAQALSPQPLIESVEFHQFYQERFENPMADPTALFILELKKSLGGLPFRRFLTGHSGTGKSTEITRLSLELQDKFEFIRIRAQEELSPFSTQPFDLLEVMAIRLVEKAGELQLRLPTELLQRLQRWFSEVTETATQQRGGSVEVDAEAGIKAPSLLNSVLKLGTTVKGNAKFSSDRTIESVRRRLQRISELIQLSNDLYREANRLLMDEHHREWVFLV